MPNGTEKHIKFPNALQPFGHCASLSAECDGHIPMHDDLLIGVRRFPSADHMTTPMSRFSLELLPAQLSSTKRVA
jgi:hypothetical protein